MSETISNQTGDGVTADLVQASFVMPDLSNQACTFVGMVQKLGFAKVSLSGSPQTVPLIPGSGSIFWNLLCDYTTGVVRLAQSTVAFVLPGPTEIEIFRQTLTSTTTDPATMAQDSTPDTW